MVHLNKLMGLLKIEGGDGSAHYKKKGQGIGERRGVRLGSGEDYLFEDVYAQLQLFVNLAESFFK